MRQTTILLLLSLLLVTPAFAADQAAPAIQPQITHPDDFTPHPCAPTDACESLKVSEYSQHAARLLGLKLSNEWVRTHSPAIIENLNGVCAKIATCYTVQGASASFCHDSMMPIVRRACDDRFEKGSHDDEQCQAFVEVWAAGVDLKAGARWRETQACAKPTWTMKTTPPQVWMVPDKIARDYTGDIVFYSVDSETKIPLPALVTIEGQNLFTSRNPTGRPRTYYPFQWPVKLDRVATAGGHHEMVAPMVTVQAEGYPAVRFRMPTEPPKMLVEMKPSAAELKPGKNVVTITTRDAETGKPVETRIMLGRRIAGESGKPFELNVDRKKPEELWVTDLFTRYSDVVVIPAK